MKIKIYPEDLSASIIVFLVALPLCLGIALASNVPPVSGLIAGIVGGIVVGIISNSALGVSGPAAGLVAICISVVNDMGVSNALFLAVALSGIFQIIFGVLKFGKLSYFFPSSVISGMLSAIGIIIILKQLPHALGYNKDYEGDTAFIQPDNENTFSEILHVWNAVHLPSLVVFITGILIAVFWQRIISKKFGKIAQIIQAPLVIIITGIIIVKLFLILNPFSFQDEYMVRIPSFNKLVESYQLPEWKLIYDHRIWYYGFIIAFVASIETLLCVEATDNLDSQKRITDRNRELVAQGTGNFISGLLGGLPVTQVIVRSSANINFGAKTKVSTILHGFWLLLSILFLKGILDWIPLSALACILMMVGYNLAKPSTFKIMYKSGWKDFIPFMVTIITILFTDLLIGTIAGLITAIIVQFVISSLNAVRMTKKADGKWLMEIDDNASFLNKSKLISMLNTLHQNESIEIIYHGDDWDIINLLKYQKTILCSKNIFCELNIQTHQKHIYENTQH